MPRKRVPAYCHHKSTGQAFVRINGEFIYLGSYGSTESKSRYDELIAEWLVENDDSIDNHNVTVGYLTLLFMKHAEIHYRRKDGTLTGESDNFRPVLKRLNQQCRKLRAADFRVKHLKNLREKMIGEGLKRKTINGHVNRIRHVFKWGVGEELVSEDVYLRLTTLAGLQAGRTAATESDGVLPVPLEFIKAIRPYVTRQVWGLIQFQLLTGCRPDEAIQLRVCDITMAGDIWEFRPQQHKTQHRGKTRVVMIGKKGQGLIRQFLKTETEAYLFSPKDARREYIQENYQAGSSMASGKHQPGEHYSLDGLNSSIRRACEKAGVPRWHPNQLRHTFATESRRLLGLEATRTALGHSSVSTTEIYAEQDLEAARVVAAKVG